MERRRTSGIKPIRNKNSKLSDGLMHASMPSLRIGRGRSESRKDRDAKDAAKDAAVAKDAAGGNKEKSNLFSKNKRGRSTSTRPLIHNNGQLRRGKSMPGKFGKSLSKLFGASTPALYAPPVNTAAAAGNGGNDSRRRNQTLSRSRSTGSKRSMCSKKSVSSRRSSSARRNSSNSKSREQSREPKKNQGRRKKNKSDHRVKRDSTKDGKHQITKEKDHAVKENKEKDKLGSNNRSSSNKRKDPKLSKTRKTGLGTTTTRQRHKSSSNPTTNKQSKPKRVTKPDPKRKSKRKGPQPLPKPKPRSKSMPPLSTPFNFTTVYPPSRHHKPVSPLPSVDSSWRYQAVKLNREMKMRFKAERAKVKGGGSWEIPNKKRPSTRKRDTTTPRGRSTNNNQRRNDSTKDVRYRSKSADSIFDREYKPGALVPYHYENEFNYAKYDNDAFWENWEEELYNSTKFDDLRDGSFDDDDIMTPESLSLHSAKYYGQDDEEEMSPLYETYVYHDPVSSLQGSALFGEEGDGSGVKGSGGKGKGKEVPSRGRRPKRDDEDDFGVSLTLNDLEEKSTNSAASSSTGTPGRNNHSTNSSSFIAPPPHSEVRANMPTFPFAPKPSAPSMNKLVRDAVAHATSLREITVEDSSTSQCELSEITNPTYAPPLHSAIRAKKPKKKSDTSSSGSMGSATDLVSELTMPSTIKSVVRAPPLLSEVLKRKPTDNLSTELSEESSGMEEPSEENYKKHSQQPQSQTNQHHRSKSDFTPRPPPPRPPPLRGKPSKAPLSNKALRRPTHPSGSPTPDSFEDVASSFFQRPLPPLKEEGGDFSPTKSQEYENKHTKSADLPATVVQLNDAAAQLLLMQGLGSGKSPNSQSPNRVSPNTSRNLSRSYSQPTNNDLPFETLSRMQSQPNCSTTTLQRASSSSRLNNSFSGGLLINPDNVVKRNRRVEQMPFTDDFGDSGLYTGEVNEDCRPNGNGRMKYENGVFFEGKWNDGMREGNLAQRERILSGFSSWKGSGKKGGGNNTVHGMAWIDRFGKAGQYTGDVNEHSSPHGKGIMKYDFGLIAEGEWVNGVLIDGSQQPGGGMVAGQTVVGGSVFPGMGNATMVSAMGMGGMSTMGPAFPQQTMMMNMNPGGMGNPYVNQGGQSGPSTFIGKQTRLD